MKWFYDLSMLLFSGFLKLSAKISPKRKELVQGRKAVFATLTKFLNNNRKKIAWFHVASLGEYEQAKPMIRELNSRYPDFAVVLTFFSPSGYGHVAKKPQPHISFITYLPIDTSKNAQEFVSQLNPDLVFFVKYDLWANFIFAVKSKNIPLFLFSATFRKDQVYFKRYGGFFRKVLYAFDHIFTQDQDSLDLLKSIGYNRVALAGDTRFDNVYAISQSPKKFPLINDFKQGSRIIVVGSAWEEDMALIIPAIDAFPHYKFIIAPHEIQEKTIHKWQSRISRRSIKYSELERHGYKDQEVLFIDNIGMLSSLYQYARIAYIGGAFGKGLHNMLEALAFGIPVLFGELKKKNKFPEAAISQSYGCGYEVKDVSGLQHSIKVLEDEPSYLSACKAADSMVRDNLGTAEKIMDQVQKITGAL